MIRDYTTEIEENPSLFEIETSKYESSWDYYLQQYYTLLISLTEECEKYYLFNSISRPYMSLLRHFCELLLKANLSKNGVEPANTHNFPEIFTQYQDNSIAIPEEIIKAVSVINFDEHGASFRYLQDKGRAIYFKNIPRIELHAFFEHYNSIPNADPLFKKISNLGVFSKPKIWDFTGHMHEVYTIQQIKTGYNEMIDFIVRKILKRELNINDVILPLFFYIRHSIELGLKFNIQELIRVEPDEQKREKLLNKVSSMHNIDELYKTCSEYLDQLDLSKFDAETKQQYDDYKAQTKVLVDIIHPLDPKSLHFRYPMGNNLALNQNSLIDVLKLYYVTNPFLTFTTQILKENDILPLTDEEMRYYFGDYD